MTNGSERITHELLVRERAIRLSGVEERDTEVRSVPDKRNRLAPSQSGAAVIAQAHAAKPERGYLQPTGAQRPLLQAVIHGCNPTTIHCRVGHSRRLWLRHSFPPIRRDDAPRRRPNLISMPSATAVSTTSPASGTATEAVSA